MKSSLRYCTLSNVSSNAHNAIFFRNDDVHDDDVKLRRLIDIFIAHETPLNLEIIPGLLTDDCIRLLKKYKKVHPELLELHQHGLMHVNHEIQGRKCEFGSVRSYDEQLADIATGMKRLTDAFGEASYPAFTPPWNRCTEDTYKALDALGFKIFSGFKSKYPITGYKFEEISVTLDLYTWKNGPVMRAPEDIMSELDKQLLEGDRIGIMLHHEVMEDEAFKFLDSLLNGVQTKKINAKTQRCKEGKRN